MQKILDILLNTKSDITGSYLCNILGVSARTIRSDIKELNDMLTIHGAKIVSNKKGYTIEVFSEQQFRLFLSKDQNEKSKQAVFTFDRADFIIERLLINELQGIEAVTQNDLADELHMSLSSLKNDMRLARIKLAKFNVFIEKKGNRGIALIGSEERIRSTIHSYIFTNSQAINEKIHLLLEKQIGITNLELEALLQKMMRNFAFRLSDIAYNHLYICLQVILVRNYQRQNVAYTDDVRQQLQRESQMIITNAICDELIHTYRIELAQDERFYLTKHIISSSYIALDKEVLADYTTEKYSIVNEILTAIYLKFNINFKEDQTLITFLANHLRVAINKAKYGIQIKNTMLHLIKNNYPFALELAFLTNDIITTKLGIHLIEDEIGFIALHFAAALDRLRMQAKTETKKVIIVCTTGIGTSLLLKVKLEAYFKNQLQILDTISWYEFNEQILEEADLIISTVDLHIKQDKVIWIKNLLNEAEIRQIEEKLDMNAYDTNGLISKFRNDLFFTGQTFSSREEVLRFLTNVLIDKSEIDDDVIERIFEREALTSTEIGSLTAIPHVMHSRIKSSFIAVVVMDKALKWQDEQVQLVLLIGMAEQDRYEWKTCLECLYKNITHIEVVKNLLACKDYDEFIKIIRRF